MKATSDELVTRIINDEKYKTLVRTRSRFAWTLTALMVFAYVSFLFLVAFKKEVLAQPIGSGVTTWSIPVGIGLIVFTVLITGFYVRRANSEFDAMTAEIVKEHQK